MRKHIYLFFIITLVGCSNTEEVIEQSAEEKLLLVNNFIKEEKYLEAIEELKILRIQYPASSFADSVQFMIAECRFFREEYLLASGEYDQLIMNMPTSNFANNAKYKKALSYFFISPKSSLDQKYTLQAIDNFQLFLETATADSNSRLAENHILELNNKLAKKIYESAEIYSVMGFNKAATIYYNLVLDKFPDSEIAELSQIKKIKILIKRKQFENAEREVSYFKEKYPNSKYGTEANDYTETIFNLKKDVK